MRIVAKNTDPFIVLGKVPQHISALMRQYWRGEIRAEDQFQLGEFLDTVHAQRGWIECDCMSHTQSVSPCLTVCELSSGNLGLRRLTKRANHAQTCDFHWDQADLKPRPGEAIDFPPDFLIFKPDRTLATVRSGSGGDGGHAERRDILRRNLFWLIGKAGLNTLDGGSVQSVNRYHRLVETAKTITLPGVDLPLSQVLWTNPDALLKGWAASTLLKLKQSGGWPKTIPAQGYLVIPVKDVEGQRLLLSGDRSITVRGTLTRGGSAGTAPYMAIVALRLSGSYCEAERAYVHPVRFYEHRHKEGVWKHYFDMLPVDSTEMRQTGDVLAQIARRVASETRGEHRLLVERPLTPAFEHGGEKFSPDFVLQVNGAVAYIQIRTSSETDYVSRKDIERGVMLSSTGESDRVFVTDRIEGGKTNADFNLERRLFGWLRNETGII